MDENFKKLLSCILLFAFLILFWNSFNADMIRREGTQNFVQRTQTVRVVRPIQQQNYNQVYNSDRLKISAVYYSSN